MGIKNTSFECTNCAAPPVEPALTQRGRNDEQNANQAIQGSKCGFTVYLSKRYRRVLIRALQPILLLLMIIITIIIFIIIIKK